MAPQNKATRPLSSPACSSQKLKRYTGLLLFPNLLHPKPSLVCFFIHSDPPLVSPLSSRSSSVPDSSQLCLSPLLPTVHSPHSSQGTFSGTLTSCHFPPHVCSSRTPSPSRPLMKPETQVQEKYEPKPERAGPAC